MLQRKENKSRSFCHHDVVFKWDYIKMFFPKLSFKVEAKKLEEHKENSKLQ